jgi:hypothetical protein
MGKNRDNIRLECSCLPENTSFANSKQLSSYPTFLFESLILDTDACAQISQIFL